MFEKKQYKDIFITDIGSITIFHFSDSYFNTEESIIFSISQFVEYVEYHLPHFVIIDKAASDFNNEILLNFLKKTIDEIYNAGVIKIFFLVSKNRFLEIENFKAQGPNSYRRIEAFSDYDSCFLAIHKHIQSSC